MVRHLICAVACVSLIGCAAKTTTEPAAAAGPETPPPGAAEAIKAAFARELEPLSTANFTSPTGFSGTVEAQGEISATAGEEFDTITLSLGTEQAMQCILHPTRIDGGGTLRRYAELIGDKLELKALAGLEIQPVEGSPLLFAELVYLAETKAGKMAGLFKLGIMAHETHSLICTHDEPGYSETFRRVVLGLAKSLATKAENPLAKASFAEVQICKVGETKVGYVEQASWQDAKQGRRFETHTSHVIPKGGPDFSTIDTIRTQTSDKKDVLVEDISVVVVDNQIGTQLRLESKDGGKTYAYQGTVRGEALEGTFKAKKPLTTELGRAKKYSTKSGGGPAGEQRFPSYEPNLNPKDLTEVIYRKDATTPNLLEVGAGDPLVKVRIDEHGLFERTEIPMGETQMICERAFARGTP